MWLPSDAMRRAQERSSLWLIVTLPFSLFCIFVLWYIISSLIIKSQYIFATQDSFYCRPSMLGGIIVMGGSFLAAVPIGLLIANICIWFVKPIRKRLDKADAHISFGQSNRELLLYGSIFCILGILLAGTFVDRNICFSDHSIAYKPFIFASTVRYDAKEILLVQPHCVHLRSGWAINYNIKMIDGLSLNFQNEDLWQKEPITRIGAILRDAKFDYSYLPRDCPVELRNLIMRE